MKYECLKILRLILGISVLGGCQRSSAVDSPDTASTVQEETANDSASETESDLTADSQTGSWVDSDSGDSEVADSILGSWVVRTMFLDGQEIPVDDQYAFSFDEGDETVAMNVIIFVESSFSDEIEIDGLCSAYPCFGSCTLQGVNRIDLEFAYHPLSSVVVPPESCPDACHQWIGDYVTIANSATGYQINDDQLILFNESHENEIYFRRSTITVEDLPY